jgi:hypothetical protein
MASRLIQVTANIGKPLASTRLYISFLKNGRLVPAYGEIDRHKNLYTNELVYMVLCITKLPMLSVINSEIQEVGKKTTHGSNKKYLIKVLAYEK